MSARNIVRAIFLVCALAPAAAAALLPLWLVAIVVDEWGGPSGAASNTLDWPVAVAWAVVGSMVVMKFVPGILVALSWPDIRVGVLFPVIWAVAVFASAVIVLQFGIELNPQLAQLRPFSFAAVTALFVCIEVVGTLALPAAIVLSRQLTIVGPAEEADDRPTDNIAPPAPSSPIHNTMTDDEVWTWLRSAATARTGTGPPGMIIDPDGAIKTSQRQLAQAIGLPKTNLRTRLRSLTRSGRIKLTTTSEATVIRVVD